MPKIENTAFNDYASALERDEAIEHANEHAATVIAQCKDLRDHAGCLMASDNLRDAIANLRATEKAAREISESAQSEILKLTKRNGLKTKRKARRVPDDTAVPTAYDYGDLLDDAIGVADDAVRACGNIEECAAQLARRRTLGGAITSLESIESYAFELGAEAREILRDISKTLQSHNGQTEAAE